MARESFAQVAKRRVLGLLLIAIVAAGVTLSIAIYNKAFTATVPVTLRADHTGNELIKDSDVKERGIIVGSVKSVSASGSGAVVQLELQPSRINDIPSDVTAQILPKTLFGEQYVALSAPAHPDSSSTQHIKSGDVIPQDRSKGALETEKVLGDLLPVLTAVDPADLNSTLTAIATALHGRGNELGQTLQEADAYLKKLNPHTKQLADDLGKLGKVADEYNGVAPDILQTFKNFETGARTVVQKRQALSNLLGQSATTSDVLRSFLADNEQRLIRVNDQNNSFYGLLAEYSPEFSCMFAGINKLDTLAKSIIYDHAIHLTITLDNSRGQQTGTRYDQTYKTGYVNGEQAKIVTGYGPNCVGLPNNPTPTDSRGNFQIPAKYKCLNDGAPFTPAQCAQGGVSSPSSRRSKKITTSTADNHALNSAAENAMVNTLIAGSLKTTPNRVHGIDTVLAAPLLRGQQVTVDK